MRRVAVEFGRALLAALLLVALAYGGAAIATSVGSGSPTVSITLSQGISAVSGSFSGDVGIAGNLGVTGTLGVTGAASLKSTLGVAGAVSITGSVGITGTSGSTGLVVIGNGNGPGGYFIGGVGSGTPAGLVVQAGGSAGSLGTPAVTTGALIVQGRSGNYGLIAKGGNTNGSIGAYFEGTGAAGQAFTTAGLVGFTNASYTAGTTQTQAGATLLSTTFNRVTTGNANDGVALPVGVASVNTCLFIDNISANALKIYPNNANDDTINGGAADASVTLAANGSTWVCTADGVAWITGNLD